MPKIISDHDYAELRALGHNSPQWRDFALVLDRAQDAPDIVIGDALRYVPTITTYNTKAPLPGTAGMVSVPVDLLRNLIHLARHAHTFPGSYLVDRAWVNAIGTNLPPTREGEAMTDLSTKPSITFNPGGYIVVRYEDCEMHNLHCEYLLLAGGIPAIPVGNGKAAITGDQTIVERLRCENNYQGIPGITPFNENYV